MIYMFQYTLSLISPCSVQLGPINNKICMVYMGISRHPLGPSVIVIFHFKHLILSHVSVHYGRPVTYETHLNPPQ